MRGRPIISDDERNEFRVGELIYPLEMTINETLHFAYRRLVRFFFVA
jgi:hypothetical protein